MQKVLLPERVTPFEGWPMAKVKVASSLVDSLLLAERLGARNLPLLKLSGESQRVLR